jgi:hypothetical protein
MTKNRNAPKISSLEVQCYHMNMTAETYPLYGFVGDQYGNEDFFTLTIPFFQSPKGLIFKQTPSDEVINTVEAGEERFLYSVETKVEGTLDNILILTGEGFANKLSLVNMSNNLASWNKEDNFFWTLSTLDEYNEHQKAFKEHAANWLLNHLKTHEAPVEESVEAAISIIHTSGFNTKDDFVLTGVAQQLLKDDRGYQMIAILASANFTDSFFNNEKQYHKAVKEYRAQHQL